MRAALAALGLVAAATLGACSAAAPMPTPPPGAVVVIADHTAFTTLSVTAPAGAPFTVFFENRESEPHNVRVWDAANATLGATEIVGGPSARTLDVAALVPGTYRLTCDIHPEMTAQLLVE